MTELKLDDSPFQQFLGVYISKANEGEVEIRMPFRDEFLRATDGSDWLHGGILSALIDIAGDYAVVSKIGSNAVPTIDLRVDFLRPAIKGELIATGKIVKVGRTISVANVEVHDEQGKLIAIGRGVYACPKQ